MALSPWVPRTVCWGCRRRGRLCVCTSRGCAGDFRTLPAALLLSEVTEQRSLLELCFSTLPATLVIPTTAGAPGAGHGRQARRQQQVWLQRGGGTPTAAPAREAPTAKGRRLGLGPPVCTRRLLLRPHSVASGSHPLPVSSRAPPSGPVCALISQSRRIRAHPMTSIQLNTSGAAPLQTQSRSEVLAAKTSTCEFYRTRFSPHTCSGTPRSWQ